MAESEENEFGEDFRYVVRVASTDLDGKRKVADALTAINGVGRRMARVLMQLSELDPEARIGNLSEEETAKFDLLLERLPELAPPYMFNRQHDVYSGGDLHLIGQDLQLQVKDDINTLKKIRSYRGIRHETGQKVRGQRSKSNGRSGLTLGVSRKK